MGLSEGLSQSCYFWNSGFNYRIVLRLVQTNFSPGRMWCISWTKSCVCWSDAAVDFEYFKGLLRGETWLPVYKWATWIWEAKLYALALFYCWIVSLSVEVLRGCSTKLMLSAKRLLGLFNLLLFLKKIFFFHSPPFWNLEPSCELKGLQNIGIK